MSLWGVAGPSETHLRPGEGPLSHSQTLKPAAQVCCVLIKAGRGRVRVAPLTGRWPFSRETQGHADRPGTLRCLPLSGHSSQPGRGRDFEVARGPNSLGRCPGILDRRTKAVTTRSKTTPQALLSAGGPSPHSRMWLLSA